MELMQQSESPHHPYDVELVSAPIESSSLTRNTQITTGGGGNYCKSHDCSYTQVSSAAAAAWQQQQQQQQHINDENTQHQRRHRRDAGEIPGSTAAAAGLCRYLCKDHVYESPTFDEHGTLQWSPYYWHGAAPCSLYAPRQQPHSSTTAAVRLQHMQGYSVPSSMAAAVVVGTMQGPSPSSHYQRQQFSGGGGGGAVTGALTAVDPAAGTTTTTTTVTAVDDDNDDGGQMTTGNDVITDRRQTQDAESVVGAVSSSVPDVTLKHTTSSENHYT